MNNLAKDYIRMCLTECKSVRSKVVSIEGRFEPGLQGTLGETHYTRTDGLTKTLSDFTPIARAKGINS